MSGEMGLVSLSGGDPLHVNNNPGHDWPEHVTHRHANPSEELFSKALLVLPREQKERKPKISLCPNVTCDEMPVPKGGSG